jgi:Kef-type K+ transport system membrane component KefB
MGLLVLAVMVGLAGGGSGSTGLTAAVVTAKAVGFIGGSLLLGRWLAPRLFRLTARLRGRGVVFTAALVTAFVLALAADLAGLAPIVGAFAAGLVLEGVPFGELLPEGESVEKLLVPLSGLLVPVFFVRMGLRVDLPGLAGGSLLLAVGLTVAAIVGKQACGLGVVNRGVDRIAVGLGMIPRGEVGLIFAGMGLDMKFGGRPVLGSGEFAAVVAMVMVTTLVTPPLLRWRLTRPGAISPDASPARSA